MKKVFVWTVLLLVPMLVLACTPKEEVVFGDEHNDTVALLSDLSEQVVVDFSEMKKETFRWYTNDGENIEEHEIEGVSMQASEIRFEEDTTDTFFENKGFEMDLNNIADGTIEWLTGYRRLDLNCTVNGQSTGDIEDIENIETINVKISCGKLSSQLEE